VTLTEPSGSDAGGLKNPSGIGGIGGPVSSVVVLAILASIAVAMVLTTGGLLRWAALAVAQLRASVVLFLLVMMTGMLIGAAFYFVDPSPGALVEGFWIASIVMSASVPIVFIEVLREARRATESGPDYRPVAIRRPNLFASYVLAVVVGNELLMGWVFQRAAGGPIWLGGGGVLPLLSNVFISPWFVFPMALEMGITLSLLAQDLRGPVRWLLALQPVVMVASPPTLVGPTWVVASAVAASVAMAAALGFVLWGLYRGVRYDRAAMGFVLRLFVAFGVMAAGLALWAISGDVGLFALGVLIQMLVFLQAVVQPHRFGADAPAPASPARPATSLPSPVDR